MNERRDWEDAVKDLLFPTGKSPSSTQPHEKESPPPKGGFFKTLMGIFSPKPQTSSPGVPEHPKKKRPTQSQRRAARSFRNEGHVVSTEDEFLKYLAQSLFRGTGQEELKKGKVVLKRLSQDGVIQRFVVKDIPMVYHKR
ncbi:hypothetical protein H8D30_02860 [bacterium]|nr:hypothetical protein [bacterium]